MRWFLFFVLTVCLVPAPGMLYAAHSGFRARGDDGSPADPILNVGGLNFTLPARWIVEIPENSARAGQWEMPPLQGEQGQGGEAVALYFGPGAGGDARQNVEAWIGTMFDIEGHPAAARETHHTIGVITITQVVILGTYNQVPPLPGVPPVTRMNYGLVGAVIEGPRGSVYWRFTGPEALITANLPLFNKIIDSLKPENKPN